MFFPQKPLVLWVGEDLPQFSVPFGAICAWPSPSPSFSLWDSRSSFLLPEKQRAIRWQGWGRVRDQPLRCFSSHPASSILAQGSAPSVAHKLSEWVGTVPATLS